jgi:hypothetical protein
MLFKQFVNVTAKVTLRKAKFSNNFVHNEVKSKEKDHSHRIAHP